MVPLLLLGLVLAAGRAQPPCLLLSKPQGIYALEAGTASDWRGLAPAKLLLEVYRQELLSAIAAGRPGRILVEVSDSANPYVGIAPAQLLPRYVQAAIKREGTMVLFVRRTTKDQPPEAGAFKGG